MRYIPALDGVRAFAICTVLLHHADPAFLPGGWIGVDIFFVLSGYLITSILLNELNDTGEISLRNFYIRRALRLTPPLVILALLQFARAPFSHHPMDVVHATLVAVAYLENWNGILFSAPRDALSHTWSLATEEQFYWLWPLLLPLLFKRRPLAWIGGAAVVMTAIRVGLLEAGYPHNYIQIFLGDRPVGLMIGCALAFLPIARWKLPHAYGAGGIVAIVTLAFGSELSPITLMASPLAGSLATAVLIVCLQRPGFLTGLFSATPVRYVAKISYGLYLYHFPIFTLMGVTKPGSPHSLAAMATVVSVALAALSYEFAEKPILEMRSRMVEKFATVKQAA